MKNKILVPLLFLLTLTLGYCIFFNHKNADTNLETLNPNSISASSSYKNAERNCYKELPNDQSDNIQNINNNNIKRNVYSSATTTSFPDKSKKLITITDFFNNLTCTSYILHNGETLTQFI